MALEPRREAFRVDTIARGFDHQRSIVNNAFGDYVANAATTFQAGMLVDLNAAGEIIVSAGANPYGWAKYNKNTAYQGIVVGEYVQLNGLVATTLAHANLLNAGIGGGGGATIGTRVGLLTTGAVYVEATDYTINYVNGTIVRLPAPGGSIADGAYVYVNYQYTLTAQELADDGHNFWNFDDDVTIQGGKVTVVTGDAIIYTTMFDPTVTYTVGAIITAGVVADLLSGYVTVGGAGLAVGRCVQIPTPSDPFLGVKSNF